MVEIQPIRVEVEREHDGRILASIPDLPGVMAYGRNEADAIRKVKTIALQVLADMIGSHRKLQRAGWPNFTFCFHDHEEVGPAALAKIGKDTGLRPENL